MPVLKSEQKPLQVVFCDWHTLGLQEAEEVLELDRAQKLVCLEHIELQKVKGSPVVYGVEAQFGQKVISFYFASIFGRKECVVSVENSASQNHETHVDRRYAAHLEFHKI